MPYFTRSLLKRKKLSPVSCLHGRRLGSKNGGCSADIGLGEGPKRPSGRKEFEHGLLVQTVADAGHVIAAWNDEGAAVCKRSRERPGRSAQIVVLAANHKNGLLGASQLDGGPVGSISAHASSEREPVLSGLVGKIAKRLRHRIDDRALVFDFECRSCFCYSRIRTAVMQVVFTDPSDDQLTDSRRVAEQEVNAQ